MKRCKLLQIISHLSFGDVAAGGVAVTDTSPLDENVPDGVVKPLSHVRTVTSLLQLLTAHLLEPEPDVAGSCQTKVLRVGDIVIQLVETHVHLI